MPANHRWHSKQCKIKISVYGETCYALMQADSKDLEREEGRGVRRMRENNLCLYIF